MSSLMMKPGIRASSMRNRSSFATVGRPLAACPAQGLVCYNGPRPSQTEMMGRGVTAAHRTLNPWIQVRILAPQPDFEI